MDKKFKGLKDRLASADQVILAYSGGVDSSLLLALALEVLGSERVLAVLMDSPLMSSEEVQAAQSLAKNLGADCQTLYIDELESGPIRYNHPDSWYYSKKLLFSAIDEIKNKYQGPVRVMDGNNADDLKDYRPGLKARDEHGVVSPLAEAGITKAEIRDYAQAHHYPFWDKPSYCSISSRFPYNHLITRQAAEQVLAAESYLKKYVNDKIRVRYFSGVAVIEVYAKDFDKIIEHKEVINHQLEKIGFSKVTINLAPYEYGSMNKQLDQP